MGTRPEVYERVVLVIEQSHGSRISVPDLSKLLGVKPTTLNARFRRERIAVQTVGRTNYISHELALRLAELHKYALFGWPTLQEASVLTTFKDGTLKARCEKGKLEGHIDLTKRLRVNPAELEQLRSFPAGRDHEIKRASGQTRLAKGFVPKARRHASESSGRVLSVRRNRPTNGVEPEIRPNAVTPRNKFREQVAIPSPSPLTPPLPAPQIELITRKSYRLPEVEETREAKGPPAKIHPTATEHSPWLDYLPDEPFSISECSVGKEIYYGSNRGTIVKLIDDPFTPRIQVNFPEHPHPAMREVQLIVGRRKFKK
jgi:hypothetical protein